MKVFAILAVRWLALGFIASGCCLLLGNLLDSYREFDPTYLWYYVQQQLLRPFLVLLTGLSLWLFSRPLALLLVRGLRTSHPDEQA